MPPDTKDCLKGKQNSPAHMATRMETQHYTKTFTAIISTTHNRSLWCVSNQWAVIPRGKDEQMLHKQEWGLAWRCSWQMHIQDSNLAFGKQEAYCSNKLYGRRAWWTLKCSDFAGEALLLPFKAGWEGYTWIHELSRHKDHHHHVTSVIHTTQPMLTEVLQGSKCCQLLLFCLK